MATKSAPVVLDPKFSVSSAVLDTSGLPAYEAGDYILFLVTWYANRTVSALTAGWSHLDAITTSGAGISHAAVYKKAASSSEASPTITFSSASNFVVTTAYVIKGADATNFLDGGDGVGYKAVLQDTTATTITTGALTPANNNALIFCVCGCTDLIRFLQADLNGDMLRFHDNNGTVVAQSVGYKQQNTAAADGGFVGYLQASQRSSSLTIAIKDDGNNTRAKDGRTSIGRLDWYGLFGSLHDGTTWSANAPSAMAGGNLGTMGLLGATVSTTALAAPATTSNNLITSWGTGTQITTTESANVWSGKYHTHSAKDLTGMLLSLNWIVDNNPTLMGDEGLLVVIADGSNQWIAYQLCNKLGIIAGDPRFNVIDLEAGTVYDKSENYPGSGGAAFDFTDHTQTGYLFKRNTAGAGNRAWKIKDALLHPKTGYSLRGGSAGDLLTPSFLKTAVCGWGYPGLVGLNDGSAEQIVSRFPVTYGDGGTTLTYFNGVGSSFEYPNAYNVSTQRTFNIPEDELTLNLKAGASDTILINSCAVVAGQRQKLEIDAATSASANLGFSGAAIDGWLFTDNAGVEIPDATYTRCGTVSFKGDATNVNISGTVGAVPAVAMTANNKTIATSTIDLTGTSATYHLSLPDTVTALTMNGVTLSGTPATNKIYSALTSGELTITLDGTGTALVAGDVTFAAGTAFATIASPTYYRGLNFTGLVDGSKVKVFIAGSQTVLFGTDSVTGNAFAFDDSTSGSTTVDYTIQKAGYVPTRVTGAAINGSTVQATGRPDTAINQVIDRAYVTSSDLTYGTTAVVTVGTNPTTNPGTKTFQLTTASTGQNWYSFWIEQWIDKGDTGEVLANVEFPLAPNGPNSFTLNDGWTFSDGATSIAFLTRDGIRYLDTSDVLQKAWAAILTSGAGNNQVRYQQSDGGTTNNGSMVGGEMDQLVQVYDASAPFDYRGYLILKIQAEGYDQAESNVVTLYGQLEDQLYVVGLTPTANTIATGDPALTIALTREVVNDVTSGKTFGIKIVSADSGTDIMRELRYNFGAGGEYPAASGYDGFDWHDLVQQNGSDFKTVRGNLYGTAAVKGVVVYSAGTTLHPDFTLFTADDGTTYSPPVAADISITGMPDTVGANNRLQIINSTAVSAADWTANTPYTAGDVVLRTSGIGSENTAGLYFRATTGGTSHVTTEPTWDTTVGNTTSDNTVTWTCYAILYYDADPAATSLTDTYIDGEEFLAGETIEIRFAEEDPAVSFKIYSTSVIAATTGFSALANSTADSVYATYALSGAAYDTTYSPNYVASYMVLDTNTNFTGASSFAYYCYLLTTSEGMYRFWGGLTALDPGNVRNNVDVLDLFFDETAGFVRQTDDVRIFKSDGTRPALDPTTGGAGIEINWKVPVNVVTTGGSAVLPQDIVDIADAVRTELTTELTQLTKVAKLHAIDATLVVTPTTRTAGSVSQTISTVGDTTTVT